MNIWVVIDVGCHECGVNSEPIGAFASRAEAEAAANAREDETDGWRDDGQTRCEVFEVAAP